MGATTTYRLVRMIEGRFIVDTFEGDNVYPAMAVRGFDHIGFNSNPAQREELQGQPKFAGVCGPMWDRDAIRYESVEAYERLSA